MAEKKKEARTFEAEFTVMSVDGEEVRLSHDHSVSNAVLRQKGASKALKRGDVVDVVFTVREPVADEGRIEVSVPVSDASKLPGSAEPVK